VQETIAFFEIWPLDGLASAQAARVGTCRKTCLIK